MTFMNIYYKVTYHLYVNDTMMSLKFYIRTFPGGFCPRGNHPSTQEYNFKIHGFNKRNERKTGSEVAQYKKVRTWQQIGHTIVLWCPQMEISARSHLVWIVLRQFQQKIPNHMSSPQTIYSSTKILTISKELNVSSL